METITKICTKCMAELPLEMYSKSSPGKYGRNSRCKACMKNYREAPENRERAKEYHECPENKARAIERSKRWYQVPENRERLIECSKRWRQAPENRERVIESRNRWRQAPVNRELVKERRKRWHQVPENRELVKEYKRILRSQLKPVYIRELIKQKYKLKTQTIKDHPELIESVRAEIKIKRLLKTRKNGDTKTS